MAKTTLFLLLITIVQVISGGYVHYHDYPSYYVHEPYYYQDDQPDVYTRSYYPVEPTDSYHWTHNLSQQEPLIEPQVDHGYQHYHEEAPVTAMTHKENEHYSPEDLILEEIMMDEEHDMTERHLEEFLQTLKGELSNVLPILLQIASRNRHGQPNLVGVLQSGRMAMY